MKLIWKGTVLGLMGDQAKAGKDLAVPLNSEALDVLEQQAGKHSTNVFTYKGNPIQKANKRGWRNALKWAGIENFRWHDLRHTGTYKMERH